MLIWIYYKVLECINGKRMLDPPQIQLRFIDENEWFYSFWTKARVGIRICTSDAIPEIHFWCYTWCILYSQLAVSQVTHILLPAKVRLQTLYPTELSCQALGSFSIFNLFMHINLRFKYGKIFLSKSTQRYRLDVAAVIKSPGPGPTLRPVGHLITDQT